MMRSDLALWGVDKVDGAMVTIVGQIECTDSGRWPVQREFNRRMKIRFQQLGVDIAHPALARLVTDDHSSRSRRDRAYGAAESEGGNCVGDPPVEIASFGRLSIGGATGAQPKERSSH